MIYRLSSPNGGDYASGNYWDQRVAQKWGDPYHGAYLDSVERMDERNVRVIEWLAQGRKLDVLEGTCGYGRYASKVAPFCKSYVGVDFTRAYVEEAQRTAPPDCRFICHDLATLDLPERFDLIFTVGAGSSIDDSSAEIVANLQRHLKPGGVIAMFEENGYMVIE